MKCVIIFIVLCASATVLASPTGTAAEKDPPKDSTNSETTPEPVLIINHWFHTTEYSIEVPVQGGTESVEISLEVSGSNETLIV